MSGKEIHKVQQWALAWLILTDRQENNKQKEIDQEYLLWINNPPLWKEIYDNKQIPEDEKDAIPIMSDELGAVEKFLQDLDKKKNISNKTLGQWTEWM